MRRDSPKNILEVKLQLEAHRLKRKRYPDVQPDSDCQGLYQEAELPEGTAACLVSYKT
jgi:hypothetical protein